MDKYTEASVSPDLRADDYMIGGTHYKAMPIQPWAVIDTWPLEQRVGFYRGNAIKYLLRAGTKGSAAQDAEKAEHYCRKLAEALRVDR